MNLVVVQHQDSLHSDREPSKVSEPTEVHRSAEYQKTWYRRESYQSMLKKIQEPGQDGRQAALGSGRWSGTRCDASLAYPVAVKIIFALTFYGISVNCHLGEVSNFKCKLQLVSVTVSTGTGGKPDGLRSPAQMARFVGGNYKLFYSLSLREEEEVSFMGCSWKKFVTDSSFGEKRAFSLRLVQDPARS